MVKSHAKILLVDDEPVFLESLERGLYLGGFQNIRKENDPARAVEILQQGELVDLAIIDITMPGMTGLELLEWIKNFSPATECIMLTAADETLLAVACMKKGAFDYLVKPLSMAELLAVVGKALERRSFMEAAIFGRNRSSCLKNPAAFAAIVGQSAIMQRIMKEAELHAVGNMPVLITGETGTGKELLAQAIHRASSRAGKTFTPINMSALAGTLFDAEFYGYARGAFTGAERDRQGYLEATAGGTLFLDEIGSLPLELQGKLLRVLQEGEFIKLGTNRPQKCDIRFIAATNVQLDEAQDQGLFRRDLFYRLCGAWLALPPLRQRMEDLGGLVAHFLRGRDGGRSPYHIEDQVWQVLRAYDFPGNIRELQSIIQHAANLAAGQAISVHHLPAYVLAAVTRHRTIAGSGRPSRGFIPLAEVEKDHILKVYRQTGSNKLQTARLLEIGANTLRRKLQSYGMP